MNILPFTLDKLHQELITNPTPEAARRIMAEYCSFFGLQSVHRELWLLTATALTSEEAPRYNHSTHRHDLVFFFEFTKLLIEAVYVLQGNGEKNGTDPIAIGFRFPDSTTC